MGREILNKFGIHLTASKPTDKKILSQNTLTMEEIWRRDGNSENELDIHYRDNKDQAEIPEVQEIQTSPQSSQQPTGTTPKSRESDSDNSENLPFSKTQKDTTPTQETKQKKAAENNPTTVKKKTNWYR